ncbi:MAG: ABC transporter transmembrane domain-containing protein [Pseudomonadota bacterium]
MSSVVVELAIAGAARPVPAAPVPTDAEQQPAGSRDLARRILWFAPAHHAWTTALALISTPLLYLSFEVPKWVVNGTLGREGDALPAILRDLTPHEALIVLCAVQFAALAVLSLLKFLTNVLSANLGERFLRYLRLEAFRRMRDGHMARSGGSTPVLTQELEAIAGFAGSAVSAPIGQFTALVTVISFLIAQDWRLAVAAMALTPVQIFVVPILLRRISALKRRRIDVVRGMCAKALDEAGLAGAMRDARVAQDLRFDIHRRKFAMKAIYNMIGHMTPLAYLSIGGSLVLSGDLTIGALVAALAAYREGAGPLRELFNVYIRWVDARTRYAAISGGASRAPTLRLAA